MRKLGTNDLIKSYLRDIILSTISDHVSNQCCYAPYYNTLFSNRRFFESIKKEGYDISECVKKKIDSSLKNKTYGQKKYL